VSEVMRPLTLETIPEAIDSWEAPSEMSYLVAWVTAFNTGLYGCERPAGAPSGPPRPDGGMGKQVTKAGFREYLNERLGEDRQRTMMWALISWLTSGYAVCDEALLGLPPAPLLAYRIKDIWPRLDEMPPSVTFHFAFALITGRSKEVIRHAATRLAGELAPADELFWSKGMENGVLRWLREVAGKRPMLAFKIGVEVMLREAVVAREGRVRGGATPVAP
jgi:hypothetical protein